MGEPTKVKIKSAISAKSDTEGGMSRYIAAKVLDFESRHRENKVENILKVDADNGLIREQKRGGKNSVRSLRSTSQNSIVTHNHPSWGLSPKSLAGRIGSPLSEADILNHIVGGEREKRAQTAEGYLFSIRAPKGGYDAAKAKAAASAYLNSGNNADEVMSHMGGRRVRIGESTRGKVVLNFGGE